MLFITYWELNEDIPAGQRLEAGQKLMKSGQFPPPGVNIIRWDVTPDGWGVLLAEADDFITVSRGLNIWRLAVPGMFKVTRTAPALPVKDNMVFMAEFMQQIAAVID